MMNGEYGIEDVCLSVLNVVDEKGAHSKVMVPLTDEELENEELEDLPEELRYRPFVFNEKIHITLEAAQKLDSSIQIGETIEEEVDASKFGRVAAATAKQVIIQKVREAERNNIANEFGEKQDEMMSGLVEMEDERKA